MNINKKALLVKIIDLSIEESSKHIENLRSIKAILEEPVEISISKTFIDKVLDDKIEPTEKAI